MERKSSLYYCKICIHQKNDIQHGILCGLSQKKPDFENTCPNFNKDEVLFKKVESEIDKKIIFSEEPKVNSPNNHKPFWILIALGLVVVVLAFNYANYQKAKEFYDEQQKIKEYDKIEKIKKNRQKKLKKQPLAIYYLADKKRIAIKRKKLKKDTSFMISKHLKIVIHKKYFLSVIDNDDTPVLSSSRGYNFIYNKVKTNKSMTLTEQWLDFRQKLAPEINYFDIKQTNYKEMIIEDKNFIIPGKRKVRGAAKLVEDDEYRYFFHFFYKQQFEDYKMLHKYLNYYVKVK